MFRCLKSRVATNLRLAVKGVCTFQSIQRAERLCFKNARLPRTPSLPKRFTAAPHAINIVCYSSQETPSSDAGSQSSTPRIKIDPTEHETQSETQRQPSDSHQPHSNSDDLSSRRQCVDALADRLSKGVLEGNRSSLARAITLVESAHPVKKGQAEALLVNVMDHLKTSWRNGKAAFRIGLSGAPGAGKSTFIETLGLSLIEQGFKVAVLAVDPSSATSGGSILGDKTRMVYLARQPNAFIRPSPNCGTLGGVTRTTNGSITLCEGAGFDVILVETVGVGQSEIEVCDMVDMFCVMVPPASGDDLQALKRGIIEIADVVLVNKADGDLLPSARRVAAGYRSTFNFLRHKYDFWKPKVMLVSSLTKEGLPQVWQAMEEFRAVMLSTNEFYANRQRQQKAWMWRQIQSDMMMSFYGNAMVMDQARRLEIQVASGQVSPGRAAELLLQEFNRSPPAALDE